MMDRNRRKKLSKLDTEAHYREALELYRTTGLSAIEICRSTHTPYSAFCSYIRGARRELMFARHSIEISPEKALHTRLRMSYGQTVAARAKYGAAIRACDDEAYIEYNVSQIAGLFHLNPTALGRQLRVHFPGILERREKRRSILGLGDNMQRGAKIWCSEQYAEAVEHLRTTDDTIRKTARIYNISYSGLREHMLYYHKDIVDLRIERRRRAKAIRKRGEITGNGSRHEPSPALLAKYREAVMLYRTTIMTQKEIAATTGVSPNGLGNHLRMWYPELILEHRGVKCDVDADIKIANTKHYSKATAVKYAGAISRLKVSGLNTAEVAREFGLNPETFRMYLYEHEPELAARLGMSRLPNGKRVSVQCLDKYTEAVRLYETTSESLRSITLRLGLVYKSVYGFIRRNCPEAIEKHKKGLEPEISNRSKSSNS